MLNRTKIGQALVGAAFLIIVPVPPMLPATPLESGAVQAPAAVPDVKVTIKLSPKSIAFTAAGVTSAKKIVATEKGYKGKYKVATTCGSAVTVAPKVPKGLDRDADGHAGFGDLVLHHHGERFEEA